MTIYFYWLLATDFKYIVKTDSINTVLSLCQDQFSSFIHTPYTSVEIMGKAHPSETLARF